MRRTVFPRARGRGTCRRWLPLTVSLLLHGLLVVLLTLIPSRQPLSAGGGSLNTLIWERGQLTLDDPAPARRAEAPKSKEVRESEEPEAFQAKIADLLPVVLPATGSQGERSGTEDGPRVEGGPLLGSGEEKSPASPRSRASSASGTGQGGSAGQRLFHLPGTARAIVYVIDHSLSMGLSGSLEVARRELLASLETLPAEARFQVILYNRQAEPLLLEGHQVLVQATYDNRRTAAQLLEAVRAEGGTDHVAALRRALALQPDTIFFVTDADEMTLAEVRSITLLNHGRAAIHAIELREGENSHDDAPLLVLARANRGTHRTASVHPH